jgi:hypothetical protein
MAMKRGMLLDIQEMRRRGAVPLAGLLSLGLLASGCSGGGTSFGGPAGSPPATAAAGSAAPPANSSSFKDRVESFFSGASAKEPQPVANAQPDVDCPYIDIRAGASTLTIPPPPPDGENEAMALKYQGTFVRAARECAVVGTQMVMKVGVEGRIIVGPAGGPGQVNVPLRFAVVEAPSAGSKTIATKLVLIPVTIGPNDGYVTFTHIEEGLSFPLPSSTALDSYLVYIGFDPIGAQAQDKRPAPKLTPKPKGKPNPNAPTG